MHSHLVQEANTDARHMQMIRQILERDNLPVRVHQIFEMENDDTETNKVDQYSSRHDEYTHPAQTLQQSEDLKSVANVYSIFRRLTVDAKEEELFKLSMDLFDPDHLIYETFMHRETKYCGQEGGTMTMNIK